MPIHDWAKVEPNIFHDFHQVWSIEIRNALNRGLLPVGYFAMIEKKAAGVVPDVLALERKPKKPADEPRGGAVAMAEPSTRHVMRADMTLYAELRNRIAIHHSLGEVVAVIELVSPGNKRSRGALSKFVDKAIHMLNRGIHLLVVDLFPPSERDPQGIHKAIWDEIEPSEFELPVDKRLTLASYVADEDFRAYVEPAAVGDELRDMPVYLDCDSYVPVPLEVTYQAAWAELPDPVRELFDN